MFLRFFPASPSPGRGYPQPSQAAWWQWQSVAVGASGSRLPAGTAPGGCLKKHLALPKTKPTEARAHSWAPWEKTKREQVFLLLKRRESKAWPPPKGETEMKPSRLQNVSGNQTSFLSDFSSWERLSPVSQPHLLQPGTLTTLFMLYLFTAMWLTSPGRCREARGEHGQLLGLGRMALGSPRSKEGNSGAAPVALGRPGWAAEAAAC